MSDPQSPPLHKVVASVLASMFGVQSSRRHAEDFTSRKATPYVVVGLVVTVVFVLTIWGVVQLVLSAAR